MKKSVIFVSIFTVLFCHVAMATDSPEQQCEKHAKSYLAAITVMEEQTGQPQSINGVTKESINKMLSSMPACEADKQITQLINQKR